MKAQVRFCKIAFALLSFCFVPALCCGQSIRLYNVTSGLSENSIKCIIQDTKGYIWLATQDGLNVFNGRTFKSYGCSYQPTRGEGISTLNILSILQHRDGERIWVATQSSTILLFDPRTETFNVFKPGNNRHDSPNLCHCIAYDTNGKLWIGTDSGIYVYDETTDRFTRYCTQNSNLSAHVIQCIYCDSKGVLWIGSENGLSRFNPATDNFIHIGVDPLTAPENGSNHILSIVEDPLENLWVGTWNNGLAKLNRNDNTLTYTRPQDGIEYSDKMRVRNIVSDKAGLLWLCTNIGLFRYDIADNHLQHVILSAQQPTDNIYSCLKDEEGGVWIGSYFKGVYYISPKAKQIECYTLDNVPQHLHGSAISSFCQDGQGKIWIASENGGLSLFDPSDREFIETPYHIADDNLHALCIDGDYLYIGTLAKGLRQIDLTTGRVKVFLREQPNSICNNNVFSLFKSRDGSLYIGTVQGCSRYDPAKGGFTAIGELQRAFIYDIAEDASGNLWFACYYDGLYRYDKNDRTWTHYQHDEADERSLPHNKLVKIHLDDKQRLWICSEGGGICRYDYDTDDFHRFLLRDNDEEISLAIVYGILNDATGNLWIASNHGIYRCDDKGNHVRHFTHEDGLQSNQFNFGATFQSSTGKLYFGGVNGFNAFNPENLQDNSFRPTMTARVSYKNNKNVAFSSRKETGAGTITIPRNIKSFSIDFECLSYVAPGKNEFAYKIDKSEHWIQTRESSVTFMNFPYGKHAIRANASNGDGYLSINEVALYLNNRPPILKSRVAKVCYVFVLLSVLGLMMMSVERRRNKRAREKIREMKTLQEREAYTAKINFFTQVAHEIKTPVTLIKAPLEVVMKNYRGEQNRSNLDIIEKNTQRLLDLVNQLLDFKKVSSEGFEINAQTTNPVQLILSVTGRFLGTASAVGISIETDLPATPVNCILDTEAYVKIISNLMTNAVKHAKSRIVVSLSLMPGAKSSLLHLSVKDDGQGIPESEHALVFNMFHQVDNRENPRMSGVGLGLPLVKLLTEKHNGHAYVDHHYKGGCSMCVDIPYIESHPQTDTSLRASEIDQAYYVAEPKYPNQKVLVVEDTLDMLDFISSTFPQDHTILQAVNGKEALSILKQQDVDIIVSDISMPVMDGFELLKEIRNNDMFCHIPFIMLTVESSLEKKIQGLEYGADAYIEKPFSVDHLQATAHNLIARRESLAERFAADPLRLENEAIVSSRDHNWLDKTTALIHASINQDEISIDNLAAEMHLSRSSFQRKIKGLTGLTPIEFIRLIRLKKAAEFLTRGTYRINEVCYLVGFNKPSYFSFLFKKQFGILPRDFAHKNTPPREKHN